MPVVTYLEAIRLAMLEEMQKDERVFVIGEDVGTYGGAFRATAGFLDKFGERRSWECGRSPRCSSSTSSPWLSTSS